MRRTGRLVAGWAFALALIVAFCTAGFWQLGRGNDKQALLQRLDKVLARREPVPLSAANDAARAAEIDWAAGSGRFPPKRPVLLDNQRRDGRFGVRVYRVFWPDRGGALLVDLGWLPVAPDRTLPAMTDPAGAGLTGHLTLQGLLVPPPSAGIKMGPALAPRTDVPAGSSPLWLATRIDRGAIDRELGEPGRQLAPRVLRLDPSIALGHERDLVLLANTLTPDKHRGYAVQWFGLALAAFVTALILTFRRSRP